jgi:spore germination protein KC
MAKRFRLCALLLALLLLFNGCWNYRGLNEIAIVSGITVDRDPVTGVFKICYEIVDLAGDMSSGLKAKLVESEGMTLFDAARNAKRKLLNKLYFGNTQVVVLSQEVARSEGIGDVIDWFLRDGECRETVYILVSQEMTARDILSIKGLDRSIVAFEIQSIISEDASTTSSTVGPQLFEVFNTLRGQGKSLTLPAFHNVVNDNVPVTEANGIAVFRKDRLLGYLTPEESKYFLFATDGVKGGMLPLPHVEGVADIVSLEISQSKTKCAASVLDGKLSVSLKINVRALLAESGDMVDAGDKEIIKRLQDAAGEMVRQKVMDVIQKVQREFQTDIFGFGQMIYKKNPALWKQVSGDWDAWFSQLDVQVACEVNIVNSSFIFKT